MRFIPMLLIMGMIFYLSHQPYDFAQLPPLIGFDKLAHIIAYAILGGAFLYGLHPFGRTWNRSVAATIVILFCLLYGISDEYHQSFIPGRFVSGWDVVADCLGGLLAVYLWYRRKPVLGKDGLS